MEVEIVAIGTATPPHRLEQGDGLEMARGICCTNERQGRLMTALYHRSGVENRYTAVPYQEAFRWATPGISVAGFSNPGPTTKERMALYEEHSLPLALRASREALARADFEASTITHVVTASCTGFTAPGIDSGLIQELHLRPTTQRVHVGYMGCHGSINALRVAHGLVSGNRQARVLVCAIELCSLHFCFHWDQERLLGNALFGDGAGALVLAGAADDSQARAPYRWRLAATGSYLFPKTSDVMAWSVGDDGFAMTISSKLPELIETNLGEWLRGWLQEHGLRVGDVRSWAIHPGGPRIINAVESAVGLTKDHTMWSREVLREFGNMSSATVLFILERMTVHRMKAPCVVLGFGPGVVAEAALLR